MAAQRWQRAEKHQPAAQVAGQSSAGGENGVHSFVFLFSPLLAGIPARLRYLNTTRIQIFQIPQGSPVKAL